MEVILLILMGVIFMYGLYIYSQSNDVLNPILAFITPILIGFVVFLMRGYNTITSTKTYFIYSLGILSYLIGFVLYRIRYKEGYSNCEDILERRLYVNNNWLLLFKIISVLAIILNGLFIIRNGYSGPFGNNFLRNLRYISNYGEGRNSIATYSGVVLTFTFNIITYQYLVERKRELKKWFVVLFLGMVTCCLTTLARTTILSFVIALFYIATTKTRITMPYISLRQRLKSKWKTVLFAFVLLSIFIYIARVTNKLGSDSIFSKDLFIFNYLASPLKNFELHILNHPGTSKGYFSLGIFGRLAAKLGLGPNTDYLDMISDMYSGPVYSFIGEPYSDFGVIGVVFVMLIQGIFHSFVYRRSLKRGGYWTIFYTTCVYSNLLAFYAFQYMMSDQVYIAILIFIMFTVFGKKYYPRESLGENSE